MLLALGTNGLSEEWRPLKRWQNNGQVVLAPWRDAYLEPPHVPGVACILQAVLIALEEEL